MPKEYDIAVDFMDMTDDRRLWARAVDIRRSYEPAVGHHAIVGDEDADPRVARILRIDDQGNLELEILPGDVETHLTSWRRPDSALSTRLQG